MCARVGGELGVFGCGELTSLAPKLAPTIEENQAMAAKRQRLVRDDAKFEKALEELRALS